MSEDRKAALEEMREQVRELGERIERAGETLGPEVARLRQGIAELGNRGAGRVPEHYAGEVTPWDLERCMKSSGNAFVDARRTDAIEYCFRLKDDLREDLRKARDCLDAAIDSLGPEGGKI